MDRVILERHLEQANKHVAQGQRRIARQKEIIAELLLHGHDTTRAYAVLDTFEVTQRIYVEDRDRFQRAFAGDTKGQLALRKERAGSQSPKAW